MQSPAITWFIFCWIHSPWPLFRAVVRGANYAALTSGSGCTRVRCKPCHRLVFTASCNQNAILASRSMVPVHRKAPQTPNPCSCLGQGFLFRAILGTLVYFGTVGFEHFPLRFVCTIPFSALAFCMVSRCILVSSLFVSPIKTTTLALHGAGVVIFCGFVGRITGKPDDAPSDTIQNSMKACLLRTGPPFGNVQTAAHQAGF